MLNHLKIRSKLILLVGPLIVLIMVMGYIAENAFKTGQSAMKTVYEDRVVPLRDLKVLQARQSSITCLLDGYRFERLQPQLKEIGDIERILARIGLRNARPRDLARLRDALAALPELQEAMTELEAGHLKQLALTTSTYPELAALLAKAIITDAFKGRELMNAFTYMATAWGLAPIVAPVIGAHLQTWWGWRACLTFLLLYSGVMWALLWRYRETLAQPVRLDMRTLLKNSALVLRSPVFQSCFLAQGVCYSILLVFNIVGPFMIQNTLQLPPTYFGYLALAVGLMYFLGGLSNRLHHRSLPSPEQRLRIGSRVLAGASVLMLIGAMTVGLTPWTLALPVLVMGLMAGAMYPMLMAKGNSLFPHIAGLTSAILGFALLLVSAAMMALAGFVSVHTLTPLAVFYVVLAVVVLAMVSKFLRHQPASGPVRVMTSGKTGAV